ncbi:MAG: aminoglycoside 3'-phosphotransferase [Acidimicrobiales bacterium]
MPSPTDPPGPPPELAQVAPGWAATFAYRLVPHLTTWRLTGPDGAVRFAKVAQGGDRYPTLRGEAERMVWASPYLPVPVVVALEELGGTTILLTEALPGRDATHASWRHDLPALVRALGRGLRAFHDAVGEEWCPFRFDLARALEHVEVRVRTGDSRGDFHPEHAHLTPAAALAELEASVPPDEDLVVCHGDFCAPNVLLQHGQVTGFVDLGELGAADRWWDVAVGAWSVGWNFGEELEPLFYESYGIEPDAARIRFYRLLYDLAS